MDISLDMEQFRSDVTEKQALFMKTLVTRVAEEIKLTHKDIISDAYTTANTICGYARDGYIPHTHGGYTTILPACLGTATSEKVPATIADMLAETLADIENTYQLENPGKSTIDNEEFYEYKDNRLFETPYYYEIRAYKGYSFIENCENDIFFDFTLNTDYYCGGCSSANYTIRFNNISDKLTEEMINRIVDKVIEDFLPQIWNY